MKNYSYYFIYKTTNLINGKIYVGQHSTNNLDDGYLGSGTMINRAISKYGKENFKREVLEYCESSNINEKEIFWIKELNAVIEGYNILFENKFNTNNRGKYNPWKERKHTQETRNKISEKAKNRIRGICPHCNREMDISNLKRSHFDRCPSLKPPKQKKTKEEIEKSRDIWKQKISLVHKGKIVSEETRRRMSAAKKGWIMSTETRQNLSKLRKGKPKPWKKGVTIPEEVRIKISNSLKNNKNKPTHYKKVTQLSLDGKFIRE